MFKLCFRRYINHSCAPNCVAEVVTFERGHKIIISSSRRIQKGEEVWRSHWVLLPSCCLHSFLDPSVIPVVRSTPCLCWGGRERPFPSPLPFQTRTVPTSAASGVFCCLTCKYEPWQTPVVPSPFSRLFFFQLCYDYKFDFEDDQHKIPCHCGAVNCRKWMN